MTFAIPAYYTPISQPPMVEGWYLARSIQGKYCYRCWPCMCWQDVSHYVFLPPCQEVFGQTPELWEHQLDGYWVVTDDENEVILSTNPKHFATIEP